MSVLRSLYMSVCVTGELIQEEEAEVVEEAVSVSIEEFVYMSVCVSIVEFVHVCVCDR